MDPDSPIFAGLTSEDAALAAEVARLTGIDLPAQCVEGVAANARLLQRHADILCERQT